MDGPVSGAGEPEPPETHEAKTEKVARQRWRFPTSLVVTLLGVALTAWLLPAFTRQWDDRQKAQELKTKIVADIASATARAVTGGEAILYGRRVDSTRVADEWSLASLQIEARLRAYLAGEAVTAWQVYSWLIDRFEQGHRAQAEAALIDATHGQIRLDPRAAKAVALVLTVGENEYYRGAPIFEAAPTLFLEKAALLRLDEYLRPYLEGSVGRGQARRSLEAAILSLEEEITREVLASHPVGYSTTAHDLIHDLTPF